jgi:DNA-3-methyladenine glycosylase
MAFIERLPQDFYDQPTLDIARSLLGKYLIRPYDQNLLVGKIVETEAYIGENDPACHAAVGRTSRNQVMYGPPGYAYIYFIYGMYYCLNVVTEKEGFPAAVLLRALEPVRGFEILKQNRKIKINYQLTNGPGKICQALKLNRDFNGENLSGDKIYIGIGKEIHNDNITRTARVGINKGIEHPWRFYIKDSLYVSKK